MIDRRDIDDMEARVLRAMREHHRQTRLEIRSVGILPAVLAAIVAALLTTGGVMFLWGILP